MKGYDGEQARRDFYHGLMVEMLTDYNEVRHEKDSAFAGASDVARFEYKSLDQDGGAKGIAAWTETEWHENLLQCPLREVWMKYRGSVSPEFVPICFYEDGEQINLDGNPYVYIWTDSSYSEDED